MNSTPEPLQSDLKLGRLRFEVKDLEIPVESLPLTISRVYDSGDPSVGDFGPAWRLSVSGARLIKSDVLGKHWAAQGNCAYNDGRQLVTVEMGTGERFLFRPNLYNCSGGIADSIRFTPVTQGSLSIINKPSNEILEVLDDGPDDKMIYADIAEEPYDPEEFQFNHPDGSVYTFRNGALVAVTDRNGNQILLDFNNPTDSKVQYVRAGSGSSKTIKVVRSLDDGLITKIYAPGEAALLPGTDVATLIYDYVSSSGAKYLAGVRRLVDRSDPLHPKYETAHYHYLFQDSPPNPPLNSDHYITQMSDDAGLVSRYEYDEQGRLLSSTDGSGNKTAFGYNDGLTGFLSAAAKGRQTITDALGIPTLSEYDANGNIVLTRDGLGNDVTHSYVYDGDHVSTDTETKYAGAFSANSVVEGPVVRHYTYFAGSDTPATMSVTLPGNLTTSYEYNSYGQTTKITDANGNVTQYNYVTGNETPSTDYVHAVGKIKEVVYPPEPGFASVKTTYKYPANQAVETEPLGNNSTRQP